jgi:hypothetical protein
MYDHEQYEDLNDRTRDESSETVNDNERYREPELQPSDSSNGDVTTVDKFNESVDMSQMDQAATEESINKSTHEDHIEELQPNELNLENISISHEQHKTTVDDKSEYLSSQAQEDKYILAEVEDNVDVLSEGQGDGEGDDEEGEDDFGDFDEFEEYEQHTEGHVAPPVSGCLSEADFGNSAQLQASVLSILQQITYSENDQPSPEVPPMTSYFSERSASLWNQLAVIPPHVNPIDWKRCSIRRLLLLSLGIPLDLDEILPKKNTKRLVLPATRTVTNSNNQSTKSLTDNKPSSLSKVDGRDEKTEKEKEALEQETDTNLSDWHQLANVSVAALEGMAEKDLEHHISKLNATLIDAQKLYDKWQELKEASLHDKETFEGVIESLLEYAQRLRRGRAR